VNFNYDAMKARATDDSYVAAEISISVIAHRTNALASIVA